MVTPLSFHVLSFLLSSSTSEPDGQLGSPRHVHRCGLLCSPVLSLCSSPCISSSVSVPWYGMVGTVAGDGAPSSFFGSPLDSPFFVLWQSPWWAPSLLAADVSAWAAFFLWHCGTGWRFYCNRHRFISFPRRRTTGIMCRWLRFVFVPVFYPCQS